MLTTAQATDWFKLSESGMLFYSQDDDEITYGDLRPGVVPLGAQIVNVADLTRYSSSIRGECVRYNYLGQLNESLVLELETVDVSFSSSNVAFSIYSDFMPGGKPSKTLIEAMTADALCTIYGSVTSRKTMYLPLNAEGFEAISPAFGLRFKLTKDPWGVKASLLTPLK